jgi:large subunit ribosomal protein L13
MKVVDGKNLILGRAASVVAKHLLRGEDIAIVNAEQMVMSGDIHYLTSVYQKRRAMKNKATPENSPKWPRRPDLFVRRIVRGMLPFDKPRGRAAFKRLRVYIGVPDELSTAERLQIPGADAGKLEGKYCSVVSLCERLGFKR